MLVVMALRGTVWVLSGTLMFGAGLAGCASSPAAQGPCTKPAFTETVTSIVAQSSISLTSIDSVQCSDGWAVVMATLQGGSHSGVSQPMIFQWSDQTWVLKTPETVCGTVVAGQGRPGDAIVPESMWSAACSQMSAT